MKSFYNLNLFKLKCSYLEYPFQIGQTDGKYFDHRIRLANKDKTNFNFNQKKLIKIKKENIKILEKELISNSTKISKNFYNFEKTRFFLINFIKSKRILSSEIFLRNILLLNKIWINNLEISYLLRKSIDQIDNELAIRCLIYSDINSLDYVYWKEFEWFHHPFYEKYKNKFKNLKNIFKETNSLRDKDLSFSFKKLATCKLLDYKKNNNNKNTPIDHNLEYKNYSLAKNSKEHFSMLKHNKDILKKRELEIRDYQENIMRDFGIINGNKKWKNENILYENIKIIFNNKVKLYREYSSSILEKLRLDIYFEIGNSKYGIEYQGIQHYKSVDFFGGEKSFRKRKQLDSLKKRRCKKSNIKLIEFRYDESISINSIIKKLISNKVKIENVIKLVS